MDAAETVRHLVRLANANGHLAPHRDTPRDYMERRYRLTRGQKAKRKAMERHK